MNQVHSTLPRLLVVLLASGHLALHVFAAKPGAVAREWSRMMREQQIVPLFPPREDIRVGDVYLTLTDPTRDPELKRTRGFLEIPLLLARCNLEEELKTSYTKRRPYPVTPAAKLIKEQVVRKTTTTTKDASGAETTTTTAVEEPELTVLPSTEEATDPSLFEDERPNRLRHVAFPEFSAVRVDQASLQAVIPVEGLNLALALSGSRAREGYLKISSGESVSFPAPHLLEHVRRTLVNTKTKELCLNEKHAELVNLVAPRKKSRGIETNVVYLTCVSEVYYARTIDVGFSVKRAGGGGVNVAGSPASDPLNAMASISAQIDLLNKFNSTALSKTTPGGSLTFTSASRFGIGLRRTYARPVAVGFRGLTLQLRKDCRGCWAVEGAMPTQTAMPLIMPLSDQ